MTLSLTLLRAFMRVPVALAASLTGALAPAASFDLAPPRAEKLAPMQAERPLIGLVLGAGGTRGFAHVGVIKALEAAGIVPDIVVGVSSGAVVAALYAGGYSAQALEDIAIGLGDYDLIDLTPFGPGRIEGARLQDFINEHLQERPIEALPKRFAVVATDNASRQQTIFTRGNTGIAVRASAAVPGLFWPVRIDGHEYVDGGVTGRVPSPVARAMGADVVISVDVSWRGAAEIDPADIAIRPGITRTNTLDFSVKRQSLIAGEKAAREALPAIRAKLAAVASNKQSVLDAELDSARAPAL